MNLENVKLVVSDMDGTLLNSKNEISPLFFSLFKKLQAKNITFCAASGRQHNSIVDKLAPIKNDIFVIAENGGIAKKGEQTILSHFLDASKVLKLIPVLREIAGANIVLCCDEAAFIESKDDAFIKLFQEYYSSFKQVEDLQEIAITTPIFKIAIYHFNSSEKYIYPIVKSFDKELLIKISGTNWLDISAKQANKGNALKEVQKILKITKEETMVFGDYHNDIEMMQEADFSFAMQNAHKDIKEIAKYTTKSNNEFGVESILEQLL
ncbi:HAD family hydrolase [uncultured Polaribacter sp.]|uniref:HAD family hydrolase n=1 Tax=uncultured Polaribacter sp. TaxID=174711 RepID=UPI00262F51F4|nr:HAD family hydrolase [uncultured Polaribacter sp.]